MTAPIVHRPLRKAGRKPTAPPADAAVRIRKLAAEGRSVIGIAHRMGVGKDAFNAWLERDPALQEMIELGREDKRHALYMLVLKAAKKGNVTAALAVLNSEHNWRDGQGDGGGGFSVTIALPGALSMQQFVALGKQDHADKLGLLDAVPTKAPQ
ncbi:MAG TPA: hypothetical protein VMN38_11745 [Sphingomicrobium sp.]|nr:hypothetical protein [Sphingomicrobium sp.]